MKTVHASKEWADEFNEFAAAGEQAPPADLSTFVLDRIHRDLNPSVGWVFFKLALVHGIVGTMTLLFCPQFGISPGPDIGLMGLFMRFGKYGCMLGCGAMYLGCSVLTASLLLRAEEIRVLRRTEGFQLPLLGLLSMGGFICFGATVVFELTVVWLVGTVLGGLVTLEVGWWARRTVVALSR